MESFPTRLKKLRESRRIYQREIAEALGVTAIADYYRVSIDYLVGRTDVPDLNTARAEE